MFSIEIQTVGSRGGGIWCLRVRQFDRGGRRSRLGLRGRELYREGTRSGCRVDGRMFGNGILELMRWIKLGEGAGALAEEGQY